MIMLVMQWRERIEIEVRVFANFKMEKSAVQQYSTYYCKGIFWVLLYLQSRLCVWSWSAEPLNLLRLIGVLAPSLHRESTDMYKNMYDCVSKNMGKMILHIMELTSNTTT